MKEGSNLSLGKHNLHYLFNECHWKCIPGHYSVVHQLHKGRQGEREHVSKAGKHKANVTEMHPNARHEEGHERQHGRPVNTGRIVKDHWDKQLDHRQPPWKCESMGKRQVSFIEGSQGFSRTDPAHTDSLWWAVLYWAARSAVWASVLSAGTLDSGTYLPTGWLKVHLTKCVACKHSVSNSLKKNFSANEREND